MLVPAFFEVAWRESIKVKTYKDSLILVVIADRAPRENFGDSAGLRVICT
jgi:hypothetical protein